MNIFRRVAVKSLLKNRTRTIVTIIGVILSTGLAQDVTNSWGDPNRYESTGTNNRDPGDSDLDALSGVKTYDAAVFEASFVPEGETLTMQVVFSSEEYLEYVNTGFNCF